MNLICFIIFQKIQQKNQNQIFLAIHQAKNSAI